MERRQFLARAGAVAGGLSVGAGAIVVQGGRGGDDRATERSDEEAAADSAEQADEAEDEEVADPRRGIQEIIWSVRTGAPLAALTFDDGPHPDLTPRILEVLDLYEVKATFMMMGYAALRHPDIVAEVVNRGHEIGNHTWRHLHVTQTSAETARREIEHGTRILEDVAGVPIQLFRPPQGRLSETVVRLVTQMRQDILLWSVTRGRKAWDAPEDVAAHVVDETGPGDIIDFHDGIGRGLFAPGSDLADTLMDRRQVEVDALPRILEQLQGREVHLGTVSALRLARNQGLTTT